MLVGSAPAFTFTVFLLNTSLIVISSSLIPHFLDPNGLSILLEGKYLVWYPTWLHLFKVCLIFAVSSQSCKDVSYQSENAWIILEFSCSTSYFNCTVLCYWSTVYILRFYPVFFTIHPIIHLSISMAVFYNYLYASNVKCPNITLY